MMFSRRLALGVLATALALLVVGCSSGSGKKSAPTTTTTRASTTTTSPSHVAANLGTCPPTPTGTTEAFNAGVQGLSKKLVPIAALSVRVCRYPVVGHGGGTVLTSRSVVAQIERDTNQLPDLSTAGPKRSNDVPFFVVTFASDTQRVEVVVTQDPWRWVFNGVRNRRATSNWLNELQQAIDCKGPTLGVECVVGGGKSSDATSGTTSTSRVAGNLGPCRSKYPRESPEAVNNVGVDGLGTKLIPIDARRMRFCRYAGENLQSAGVLRSKVAVHIAGEIARLHVVRTIDYCSGGTSGAGRPGKGRPLSTFLTFASETQQVTVLGSDCGVLTNGVVSVTLNTKLLGELRTYTTPGPVPQ